MKWIRFKDVGPVVKEALQFIDGTRYIRIKPLSVRETAGHKLAKCLQRKAMRASVAQCMSEQEWRELQELAASLGLFVEHPERWEKLGPYEYRYMGDLPIKFNLEKSA